MKKTITFEPHLRAKIVFNTQNSSCTIELQKRFLFLWLTTPYYTEVNEGLLMVSSKPNPFKRGSIQAYGTVASNINHRASALYNEYCNDLSKLKKLKKISNCL